MTLQILVVDDDKNIRNTLTVGLADMGYEVQQAPSVAEAEILLHKTAFDVVLTDFKMEGKLGIELVSLVKTQFPQTLSIVMTAYASFENAVSVVKEGAFDYLPKPFTNAQLSLCLEKAKRYLWLRRENETLKGTKKRHDYFLGFSSFAMQNLDAFVRKVASTDATVLLMGESGTGKSELAHLIHELSPRRERQFVTVDCATLVESLIESEIFGHVAGSFTGAQKDKIGKLELANGGTLFLDEIGELSASAQAKLLRFLQERVVERVGSNKEVTIDTRVLVATNKDLLAWVQAGKFREDLYYRLNILECQLVALRHRREDIPIFIDRFWKQHPASQDKPPILTEEIKQFLMSYSWPGNVRELKNTIDRIWILALGRKVTMEDLPDAMKRTPPVDTVELTLQSLEDLEREHIRKVLEKEKNQEKAAQILGITTVTLWRKRKEYGLP